MGRGYIGSEQHSECEGWVNFNMPCPFLCWSAGFTRMSWIGLLPCRSTWGMGVRENTMLHRFNLRTSIQKDALGH
jgi:hypothetical protein